MIAVLLVHDNTDLIDATRSYLERMGEVRVDSVNSTKQAIEVLKNRAYDVIVSYYHMPQVDGIEFVGDMNGVELLKYLKQQGNTTPFILYARNPGNKVVLEDINYASEMVISARTPLSELRDIIKQAVVRKRSEREQNSRYEMLNALLCATPLAISRVRNGKFDWVNTPMYAMTGYAEGELSDKEMPVIFPGREEYERTCRELSIRKDGQGWGNSDTELRRKDGSTFNCRLRTRPVDPSDPAKGEMIIAEDTTERTRLIEAVKQAEIKYRELVQDSQSIILKVDTEGTITFFNKAAQAFFGWSAAEVVGKSVVGTIVSPTSHSAKEVISMMGDLSRSGSEGGIHINENVLRGGEAVWIAWTNKPVRDESGKISEILCVGNDITNHSGHDRIRISMAMWKDKVLAGTDVAEDVFEAAFHISMEIAREGREGKAVGTAFIIGDADNVLAKSRQMILNPFEGHAKESRMISNVEIREMIKELAQLDGAFIVRGDGLIEAAARRITIEMSNVQIPKGLGTRHASVAGITQVTNAIGIVVSQSGGKISIFRNGRIVQEIS
jgi:PAS domain S-box-containing protein